MVAPRRSVTVGAVKRIKATYPSTSDIPALVCVNTYDVHGSQGKPSTKASDYQPASDSDNDVTNSNPAFTLTPGVMCASTSSTKTPVGAVGGVGLAGLTGAGLVVVQRRRSHRNAAA